MDVIVSHDHITAQLVTCPVCAGQGTVPAPPWIAGDQHTWVDTVTSLYTCRRCLGSGTVLVTGEE